MSISIALVYPPHQSWPGTLVKPNGSLAYPMIGAALLEIGVEVKVIDAVVGTEKDDLQKVFFSPPTELESGLLRTGLTDQRILEEVKDADIVGLTSIFSDQETMLLHVARIIKEAYPQKLILAGGHNSRFRLPKFLENHIDIVCLSESEKTIQAIARIVQNGSRDFSSVSAVAFNDHGNIVVNRTLPEDVIYDLDQLPLPAWHLLPNERYWQVGRPHGGHAIHELGDELRYASMMTSMGCPFSCSFCHIASETKNSITGEIGRFRIKSDSRVLNELEILKGLGVKQIFIEDDSLFGYRQRGMDLLRQVKGQGFDITDVNGINLIHLFRKAEPDPEILEVLVDAGFKEISLPFETANPRIMRKYVSNKWDPINSNVIGLIKMYKAAGITLSGNYMIGYPDETKEEIQNTIDMARVHMAAGMDAAGFMIVIPLPGTPIFDLALREGYLPRDYNIDKMHWQKANMINTAVPAKDLESIQQSAWEEMNSDWYQKQKQAHAV